MEKVLSQNCITTFMKATITSLELKGPLKFFLLSASALKITRQLKASNYKDFKKKGG